MTPLIQAMRTIVHLGETVPEAEQARQPRRQGSQYAGLVAHCQGSQKDALCVVMCVMKGC